MLAARNLPKTNLTTYIIDYYITMISLCIERDGEGEVAGDGFNGKRSQRGRAKTRKVPSLNNTFSIFNTI